MRYALLIHVDDTLTDQLGTDDRRRRHAVVDDHGRSRGQRVLCLPAAQGLSGSSFPNV